MDRRKWVSSEAERARKRPGVRGTLAGTLVRRRFLSLSFPPTSPSTYHNHNARPVCQPHLPRRSQHRESL